MANPTDHISDQNDIDADAHEELNGVIDADDSSRSADEAPESWRDYNAPDEELEFDDDDGFDLSGENQAMIDEDLKNDSHLWEEPDDFDPSGGLTEADFPVEDEYSPENGWREAEADAYHSQWD